MIDGTLATALAPLLRRSWSSFGMPVLELDVAQLIPVVQRLRAEFGFTLFLDVTAVDHPARQPRFDVVYHFLSVPQRSRVRLKLQVGAVGAVGAVGEEAPVVPTLTGLYGSARFMEREVHDMYGIRFDGNADLRPILLYEGFVGHPLRKDYPMEREQPIVPYRK